MNRRQFALASLASSVMVLAGCDTESKPDHLATLLNNPAVHEAFKTLEDASSSLESNVDAFDTDNWRDVVPNVKTDSADIADGIEALKRALGYSDS
jgi:outer membrane murein-binding lipoprotein Lpp